MLAWIRKLLKPTGGVIENKSAEPCVGCQQAMLRISHGAQETHCPVCGCHWMSKEAADCIQEIPPHRPDQAGGIVVTKLYPITQRKYMNTRGFLAVSFQYFLRNKQLKTLMVA